MSSDPTAWSDAIQNWFDESRYFTYGVGPKTPHVITGHYTQVWGTFRSTCHKYCSMESIPELQSTQCSVGGTPKVGVSHC